MLSVFLVFLVNFWRSLKIPYLKTVPIPFNVVGAWKDGKNNVVTNRVVGWLMAPEKDSSELEGLGYSCFAPSTTSSYYSSDGKFIMSSTENDNLSVVSEPGKVDIFGCN